MAYVRISSENPEFSYILHKNPATQRESNAPFSRPLRKGVVLGWFGEDSQSFSLLFQDASGECSFATGRASDFEYLDQTRYASPYAPVAMVDTLLRSAAREQQPADVTGYLNTVEVAVTRIAHRGALAAMRRHFVEFDVEVTPLAGRLVKLRVSARRPLYEVLSFLVVLCVLQAIADKEIYVELPRDALAKYIRALNAIDAPYFVRYVFSRDAIQSPTDFFALRPALQPEGMVLHQGDTRKHRYSAIKPALPGGKLLVDIGCGEGFYVKAFSSKYASIVAFEQDDLLRERTKHTLESKGVHNALWRGAFGPGDTIPEGAHVLMTEVLEHSTPEISAELLHWLNGQPAEKMVFTVPNGAFNPHYALYDGEFRHSDHKWEPDVPGFEAFMREGLPAWTLDFSGIGDQVGGVSSSLMCVATPR